MRNKSTLWYVIAILAGLLFLFAGDAIIHGAIHKAPFGRMILNFALQCIELGFLGFFLVPKKHDYGYVYLIGFLVCIALAITGFSGFTYGQLLTYYYLAGFAFLAWTYAGEDGVAMLSDMEAHPMMQHDILEIGRLKGGFKSFAERAKEQAAQMRSARPTREDSQLGFPQNGNADIMGTSHKEEGWDPEYSGIPHPGANNGYGTVPEGEQPAPPPKEDEIPF